MSGQPSTAKEALLAELLGDVQKVLTRLEEADRSAQATALAVTSATAEYRGQVDELVKRMRAETASIVLKTTEHAARTLVGQQQETLQKAATQAMQQALSEQVLRRTRRDWLLAVALSGGISCALTLATIAILRG